ncbi:helix-turn-helix domain-containing protein [Streptomyces sp. SKN60]|uniref:helix-turn-helix domain-containing protein n=1 Tax=Streptomyces sp. SKN60 TaxID=2855506 RepID=UPI0022473614|nr:helix-turn-helix domain-containing protein [Streptomyces sp. SKN60]MCX2180984.1 helix-turn-helix domain-containing protein [Streptomyces sp. SKN60]
MKATGTGVVAVALVPDEQGRVSPYDLYELSTVGMVFGMPHTDLADPWYELRVCGGPAPHATHGLDGLSGADTVIVPSVPDAVVEGRQELSAGLLGALSAAADAGARMVSMCSGAFALAAAGLLDGRRATLHHAYGAELAARHPRVTVDTDVLFTDEGTVLTGAGAAAGLDLCLHLVRKDLGAAVAGALASRLVVPAQRAGDRPQLVEAPLPAEPADPFGPALQWAVEHLHEPLTVEELARRARMSARTFHRRVREAHGTTPLRWLLDQRVARAQTLLESTDLPVERIGEASGLGSAANLRRHFTRAVGVSPTAYRTAYRARFTGAALRPSGPPSTGR